MGLNNGGNLKIELGKPHEEGKIELNVFGVRLREHSDQDEVLFDKFFLFKEKLTQSISGLEFKLQIIERAKNEHPDLANITEDNVRLRNPKLDEFSFGEIVHDH